ncbi:MAG: hypothetical protein M1829_004261 [Trizodia sp. TS-e1964]|nr:MAG: hypothetical protein M1829_004261 [Trizodia sp. TS-e1964]
MDSAAAGLEIPNQPDGSILAGGSVHGWYKGAALDSGEEKAVAFAAAQKVRCMVERFSLLEAQQAYDYMLSGKARSRAVIVM